MSTKQAGSGRRRTFTETARRAQIVDAAAQVMATEGYSGTSIARIASHLGISKGVITYHFRTKDEILRELVLRFFDEGWQHMGPAVDAATGARGKIRAWVGSQLEFFSRHRIRFLATGEIMANHRGADGQLAFAEELDEEVTALSGIIVHGQQDGELRDFDPRTIATLIVKTSSAVLETWAADPQTDLQAQSAALLDFIDHAIAKEKP